MDGENSVIPLPDFAMALLLCCYDHQDRAEGQIIYVNVLLLLLIAIVSYPSNVELIVQPGLCRQHCEVQVSLHQVHQGCTVV